ncbi:MAG: hypothetical protein K8L99_05410 [Anaerolineae bacterium]|nr:hypothetical protein [Anaerolineae bacterium]
MSRVINTDSTGKKRNQNMRTGAEILRRLSQKQAVDEDVKNMAAKLVYCMREIDEGIEQSAAVWEKRDYWMKAEEFRQRWRWAGETADELQALIFADDWPSLPQMLVKLLPRFNDIKVNKFTRKESEWAGAYNQLIREKPAS